MTPRSTFEAHLTVSPSASAGWREGFEGSCRRLGLKPLLIEAPGAVLPIQPMSSSFHHGTYADVKSEVLSLRDTLAAQGYSVLRVKIEAVGRTSACMPAGLPDEGCYFELHPKVHLPPGSDLGRLRQLCDTANAHLSRNPRRVHSDGSQDRFVTLRLCDSDRAEALERERALRHALTSSGYAPTPGTLEYALLDTHVALDAGWAS